jgi:general secretion pathway protein J
MKRFHRGRRSDVAGFTLLEALVATTLMGMILAALGAITAQWLPSWNRGFMRVQRSELFTVALNRLAADLSAAEFITPNSRTKLPVFEGSPSAVTLVRSAVGPNTEPGLEVVRIAEAVDRQGFALVRTRTPFAPFGAGDVSTSQLKFTDPVVLLRAPYRVTFSYSAGDDLGRTRGKTQTSFLRSSDSWFEMSQPAGRWLSQARQRFMSSCRQTARIRHLPLASCNQRSPPATVQTDRPLPTRPPGPMPPGVGDHAQCS